MTTEQPARDDIDVASYLGAVARHWWVVLVLVAVGIVAGVVLTLLQPTTYDATASVYIGQTTDANGNPMAGLNSNAKAAIQLLSSQTLLNDAARATGDGMTAATLRRETTVETPSSTIKTTSSVVNIVVITVRDESRRRAAAAADALADALLERIGEAPKDRIALLESQVADLKRQLSAARQRGARADAALAAIAAEYPNVVLVDWSGAISQRPDLLQSDQIHPGVEGGHFYADVVARAFDDLAARLAGQGAGEGSDDGAPADA